jgi:hypothetical protein
MEPAGREYVDARFEVVEAKLRAINAMIDQMISVMKGLAPSESGPGQLAVHSAAPDSEYNNAWYTELTSYLWIVSELEKRLAGFTNMFSDLLSQANADHRFFQHSEWQTRVDEVLDGMLLATNGIDPLAPTQESIQEVHLLFKHAQLLQLERIRHAKEALQCLRRSDNAGAAAKFKIVTDLSGGLAEMARLRNEILSPTDSFANLKAYIAEKRRERARVASDRV